MTSKYTVSAEDVKVVYLSDGPDDNGNFSNSYPVGGEARIEKKVDDKWLVVYAEVDHKGALTRINFASTEEMDGWRTIDDTLTPIDPHCVSISP